MDQIQFKLTIEEANQILEALGERPYVKVAELISKIQGQAQAQLSGEPNEQNSAAPAKEVTEKLAQKAETSSTNGN